MKQYIYGERDYAFGQRMLTLRTAIGLTQAGLAELLGVSRRAVIGWETGGSYPKADHLKRFIELGLKEQIFPAGLEAEEIRALWKAAHQKVLLDEQWLSTLFARSRPALVGEAKKTSHTLPRSAPKPRVDWGGAIAVPTFYGREQELAELFQWAVQERCRVVSILGMGGIGKSALAVKAMSRLAGHFEAVIFRPLRDAPDCSTLLEDCLRVLAPQALDTMPVRLDQRLALLFDHLRTVRTLVVLDNLEALLEEGDVTGRFRPGFEEYKQLLQRVAETEHQSCLLLTSREKPASLRPLEGKSSLVRSLRLSGLEVAACKRLFADKGIVGTQQELAQLVEAYAGNPLALKIVTETILDLFGGEVDPFLKGGTIVFGSLADLLSEHFVCLSATEQTVLRWLAVNREPMTVDELSDALTTPLSRAQVLEAIDSLRRRSLIERGQRQASFTLQSVVLEYLTTQLVAEAASEIEQGNLNRLISHGLEQASAKEYVRQAQERLLVAPILTRLEGTYPKRSEREERLRSLFARFRGWEDSAQGYGPANLVVLLRSSSGHLRGADLSGLALRGAYLRGIEMQGASLAGAMIHRTTFTETLDAIWSVAIGRDGALWATGSRRGEVRLWERGGRSLHLIWQAHADIIPTLTFSSDGRTLATGCWDGSVKLWDLDSGTVRWTSWHTNRVEQLAFAPDGDLLASCGADAVVRLWDSRSGASIQTLPHPGPVFALAWHPMGHILVTGTVDGCLRVWEIRRANQATCAQTIPAHTDWVTGLVFAPDGGTLASVSWDRTVKLWEITSGRLLQTLPGQRNRALRLAWSPDGRVIASAGYDKTIWLWDVEHGHSLAALHGHTAHVHDLAFTPDGGYILSGSEDGTLRVWNVAKGQCEHVMQGYAVAFFDIDWSPDSTQLVSGGNNALVAVWDVREALERVMAPRVLLRECGVVFGVGWSPDGRVVVNSECDGTVRFWDVASGACIRVFRYPAVLLGVAWSPDGQLLASGTYWHGALVWNMPERRYQWSSQAFPITIRRVAWNPDGRRLAGAGEDGSVCVWNGSDGTLLHQFRGHHGMVLSVAWNPDGTRLASAGGSMGNGEMFVWNVRKGECVQALAEHPSMIYAVVWSPTGEQLVNGGSDGVLRWWDVQSGECVRARQAHHGTIQSLKMSPDGRRLASCGDDSTIMIWDLSRAERLHTLRLDRPYEGVNITGIRGLTEAERVTLQALGAVGEEGEFPL